MPPERLSALDASFLAVEGPSAHMHVGWAATFEPPADGPRPDFDDPVRPHRRPARPRAALPPADRPRRAGAERAAVDRRRGLRPRRAHPPLRRRGPAAARRRGAVGAAAPRPPAVGVLDRRPAARRAHRARRQGPPLHGRRPRGGRARLAAARPRAAGGAAATTAHWLPAPTPHALELLARGAWDRTREQLGAAAPPARAGPLAARAPRLRAAHAPARSPARCCRSRRRARSTSPARRSVTSPRRGGRSTSCARSRTRTGSPSTTCCSPPSRARCAGTPSAPRSARATSRRWCRSTSAPTTAASSATASRSCSSSCPPSVADPLVRLRLIGEATRARKESGVPEDADSALKTLSYAPRPVQKAAAHALASPRVYNLVVSNIPGPRIPMYLRRLPPARRLPGGAAVGAPRAVGRHDDDRRPRLLRPLRRPGDAAGLRRAGPRPRRRARRAACHH